MWQDELVTRIDGSPGGDKIVLLFFVMEIIGMLKTKSVFGLTLEGS